MFRFTLLLALSLTACLKDETISGQTDPTDVWVLQTLNGAPVSPRITLTFPEQGEIAGDAPCNRYFATQTAPLPWFEAGPIGATDRACPEFPLEAQYFEALAAMTLIEVQSTTLLLRDGASGEMVFDKE
ncbi:MAG: META domain-containing protein [Rhodobacteraceae bacterium]|nr:META domain-containing protein [Paracoccaceae bacterium]